MVEAKTGGLQADGAQVDGAQADGAQADGADALHPGNFPELIVGMSLIARTVFEKGHANGLWHYLIERLGDNALDASALWDLSQILLAQGDTEEGVRIQADAISLRRAFRVVHGDGSGLRILAFVTGGDMMANIPLDFLLHGSNSVLWLYYVDAETQALPDLPDHDIAIVAVGESAANRAVLMRLTSLLQGWQGPILNNRPAMIASLTRDRVSTLFTREPAILAPLTFRAPRWQLEDIARGRKALTSAAPGVTFPAIVRPVGTHAGKGLFRVDDHDGLAQAVAAGDAENYYVAPFVDYRGSDGFYAKQRIVLIDGRPYPSHMAISSHWMVHYLNAGMAGDSHKRYREDIWMRSFPYDFAVRHAAAFKALHDRVGLDYFGIDCAELPDGRLLVFEVDVAMVVHDMDSSDVYPYKKPVMRRLFEAFLTMAAGRANVTCRHYADTAEG